MKFENQTFKDTIVTLDCNDFIDCTIENCSILFQGGPFSFVRTKTSNVRFGVSGPAQLTIAFLKLVKAHDPALVDQLLDAGQQAAKETAPPTMTN